MITIKIETSKKSLAYRQANLGSLFILQGLGFMLVKKFAEGWEHAACAFRQTRRKSLLCSLLAMLPECKTERFQFLCYKIKMILLSTPMDLGEITCIRVEHSIWQVAYTQYSLPPSFSFIWHSGSRGGPLWATEFAALAPGSLCLSASKASSQSLEYLTAFPSIFLGDALAHLSPASGRPVPTILL